MNSDLITLPRAAVERVIAGFRAEGKLGGCTQRGIGFAAGMGAAAENLEALLAAAKPAIDAGVTQSEDEDVREDQPSCEIVMPPSEIVTVPRRGRYRWLVIAADAAEEG